MTIAWIIAAGHAAIADLVTTAASLNATTTALALGDRTVADAVAAAPVDQVVWLEADAATPLEALAGPVADLVAEARPAVVLVPNRPAERALAGAIAARTGAPVVTLVADLTVDDGTVTLTHGVFGGIALETLTVDGPVIVLADGGDIATGGSAPIERLEATANPTLTVVASRPAEHEAIHLGTSTRIVAVGRGLATRDDLARIDDLADALGADVGCSRPLAEGLGWLSPDRVIGVTGHHVAPELYVAVGISGQLQHVVGARRADTVVVINSDPSAPYFAECDFGLVGDLHEILPVLTSAIRDAS